MELLKGKSAIITGSARGIGKEIAGEFLRSGAKVAVCDVLDDELKRTHKELSDIGVVSSYKADVTSQEDIDKVISGVLGEFGSVDILVNNAGITRDNLIMRMKEEDWDLVLDVNLKGAFLLTKAVFRPMSKNRWGRIINIASVVGLMGNVGQANYVSSKAGLIGLTRATAREYSSRGITVNAVAPGYIETEMTDVLPDEVKSAFIKQIPLGRPGKPGEIAKVCLFLASEMADYITGQVLVVDGGMFMD